VTAAPPEAFDALAHAVRAHRHRLSSCILVLRAWDESRRALVEDLRRGGLEVRALLVCAPEEAPADPAAGLLVLHPGEIDRGLARLQ
jgi:hypothetical protein